MIVLHINISNYFIFPLFHRKNTMSEFAEKREKKLLMNIHANIGVIFRVTRIIKIT